MTNSSYVRTKMLPEVAPPIRHSGPILWLRENMFSNVVNSILSLLSIWFIYSLLAGVLPWVFHSSWSAGSLSECRDAIRAAYGQDATGACWAVIRERWPQLLFGFYPNDLYWRPVLVFVLMMVAIAPILFNGVPRKILWFSGLYPFIAFWLLWGGTIWIPAVVIFGFVLGAFAMVVLPRYIGPLGATISAILLPILWWIFLAGPAVVSLNEVSANLLRDRYIKSSETIILATEAQLSTGTLNQTDETALKETLHEEQKKLKDAKNLSNLKANLKVLEQNRAQARDGTDLKATKLAETAYKDAALRIRRDNADIGRIGPEPVESAMFGGFLLSILIGVTGITLSLPMGVFLALGRQSNLLVVKSLSVGFIEFIRGVPLITLLFVASTLLNYFLPPGTTFDIVLRVMIMVTLFASAYMAEVVRGGLAALPKGQYEAAEALGMDYWKSMRLIIMPQALKISIPSIVGIFIGLFKDTTLVSIIGLMDPLGLTNAIRADTNWNGIIWELYGFIAFTFFIFCFAMSRYSMYLERKLQTGHT